MPPLEYAASRQIAFLRENWPLACHFEDKTLVNWPFIWRMLMICTSLSDLKRFFKMKRIEIDIMQFSKRAKKGVVKSLFAHVFWFFITSVVEIIIFSWFVQLLHPYNRWQMSPFQTVTMKQSFYTTKKTGFVLFYKSLQRAVKWHLKIGKQKKLWDICLLYRVSCLASECRKK